MMLDEQIRASDPVLNASMTTWMQLGDILRATQAGVSDRLFSEFEPEGLPALCFCIGLVFQRQGRPVDTPACVRTELESRKSSPRPWSIPPSGLN
jgi:hypothetical protein